MRLVEKRWDKAEEWGRQRAKAIWVNLQTNHLWQRIFKNTLGTTITVIIAIIPAVAEKYGAAVYLAPITTVFGHPGRRFGMMAEALILAILGTCLGMAWSVFGIYLFSLVYETNAPAAYTIRGIFLAISVLFHGILRSSTPRLFIFVLLMVIVTVVSLTGPSKAVTTATITVILYPILTAVGVLILVNILVFPEFSSSFLGNTTIETLGETINTIRDAGSYFISIGEDDEKIIDDPILSGQDDSNIPKEKGPRPASRPEASFIQKIRRLFSSPKDEKPAGSLPAKKVTLKSLTDQKAKLRAKLAGCASAQQECNFEIAFAVLPPTDLKSISVESMSHLVANAVALIGACESKYALMGDENDKNRADLENRAKDADIQRDAHSSSSDTDRGNLALGSSWDKLSKKTKKGERKKDESSDREKPKSKSRKTSLERDIENLELVKPKKEIAFGDSELLKYLVTRIAQPLKDLQNKIDRSVDVVTSCLGYSYDVPKLPSGVLTPAGIQLQEIDIRVDLLTEAIADFDKNSAIALVGAASISNLDHPQVDIMPRMETFLISLFLLNLRQAALHTLEMLRHARVLVEKRQARHGRRRLYAPRINWRKWLTSGGEEDSLALPDTARKDARSGDYKTQEADSSFAAGEKTLPNKTDPKSNLPGESKTPKPQDSKLKYGIEKPIAKAKQKKSPSLRVRNWLADAVECLLDSDDVLYAIKLTVAVMLVTWPSFLAQWNRWFYLNRGLWAALQLVLITEVAIGASVWVFLLRTFGTTLGCLWGYIAYQADNGNRIICVVILTIGIIPSAYIQLGSKYIKAGMVSIISMCIVCLATTTNAVPGTATENFLRRLIAFLIGGGVALVLQFAFLPVKARDRLVESLGSSISNIIEMEACLAYGIEGSARLDVHSTAVRERFNRARAKAQGALTAAETFLPFCANEPRLKGSFKGLALVYAEILYVLHAIVDRMDNVIHLRSEYGSSVLEELNAQVIGYRRNVAASITIVLFAVHEALMTKLPLPQFLPSARLSHLRMVNRVREVVLERRDDDFTKEDDLLDVETSMVKRVMRQKFLSWNAGSAAQIEVIEFLEELIDLTKLLVGANEFRSGMLTRPTYREYIDRIDHRSADEAGHQSNGPVANEGPIATETEEEDQEARDVVPDQSQGKLRKRPTFTRRDSSQDNRPFTDDEKLEKQKQANEEELPRALQRVRSRRIEEMNMQRHKSNEGAKTKNGKQPA